jgi:capsid protein
MEVGDDVRVIESKIPSTESQEFYKAVTMVALKSLNIPYSFFSEDFTNFYGSRGAMVHYLRSCEAPRQANLEFLNHHLKWRIAKWITDGTIKQLKGYDVNKIRWQCVPRGIPFWDPAKEMEGVNKALTAGLMSPQQACMQIGTNFYENIDQIREALDYAEKIGVTISWETQNNMQQEKDDGKN